MTRCTRRGLTRIQSYVEPELSQRVDRFCAAAGMSESALIRSSICQYLDGTSDMALLLRRLDRIGHTLDRLHQDLALLCEGFGVFVRLWLAHTPSIPEDGKAAARLSAESRYQQFVEHVTYQVSAGRRFLDDVVASARESGTPEEQGATPGKNDDGSTAEGSPTA